MPELRETGQRLMDDRAILVRALLGALVRWRVEQAHLQIVERRLRQHQVFQWILH